MELDHRYDEHDDVYCTKIKRKHQNKTRQCGFGHRFRVDFVTTCVNIYPHYKVLNSCYVKIPDFVQSVTILHYKPET